LRNSLLHCALFHVHLYVVDKLSFGDKEDTAHARHRLLYHNSRPALQALFQLLGKAVQSDLVRQIEYLLTENQILRSKLGQRVQVSPSERRRLIRFGRVLGTDLKRCLSIVSYNTFQRWVRENQHIKPVRRKRRWRPRTLKEIEVLIVRFATENPGWGYSRILAELKKLGIQRLSRNTVKNILKAHGFDSAPKRGEDSWDAFLKRHLETLWACDFFTKTVWTVLGPKTFHALFFLHVQTRKVYLAGITDRPDQAWTVQQTRRLQLPLGGTRTRPALLIRDRDKKFSAAFDEFFHANHVQVKPIPFRSPNLNPYAEGWVGTIKRECVDHFIVFGERHLRYLVREYLDYYNSERAHPTLAERAHWSWSPHNLSRRLTRFNRLGGLPHGYAWA